MRHMCHAYGCTKAVTPRLMLCASHWAMVPDNLKNKVAKYYRPGQERDKQPSREYMATMREIQRQVKIKETGIDIGVYPLYKDVVI